jgi:beta-hydroxylase
MGRQAAVVFAVLVVLAIVVVAACAETMRRRGRERGTVRHTFLTPALAFAPYNLWAVRSTRGADTPYADMDLHFPRHAVMRDRWEAVRDEALAVCRGGHVSQMKGERYVGDMPPTGWKKFYIKWYGDVLPEARRLCPETCALLDQLPELHLAMFSVLEPGARIPPHVGPFAGNLRYHLGLRCPAGAELKVDGEPYQWEDGKDMLFDVSYVHEVVNRSNEARVILFADVERRLSGPWAQAFHNRVCRLAGPLVNRVNNKNETPVRV